MKLPIMPPYPPMEASLVDSIPVGGAWQYEPKWDGFRCLAFRDGAQVLLQSKSGQPLERYFPEIVRMLLQLKATKFVLDGELVAPKAPESSRRVSANNCAFSFDALLQRIHPAASRIAKLAAETPAYFIVFDLLINQAGKRIYELPLASRREELERFMARHPADRLELSPKTAEVDVARKWLSQAGDRLDGVIAKRVDLPYRSGTRDGMQKVKRMRTADCVVGGFRYAAKGKVVGSLLLGLYDKQGLLHHVGFTSSFAALERRQLTKKLEPLIHPPGFTGNKPGGPSRWSTKKSSQWEPLATKLVVEVQFDHFTGGRFRHGTKFLRWRPDKNPKLCLLEQVEAPKAWAETCI